MFVEPVVSLRFCRPAVTEFVCGGELFASAERFSDALVQLYVLEIAIALGTYTLGGSA